MNNLVKKIVKKEQYHLIKNNKLTFKLKIQHFNIKKNYITFKKLIT